MMIMLMLIATLLLFTLSLQKMNLPTNTILYMSLFSSNNSFPYISMLLDWMAFLFMTTVTLITSTIILFSWAYIPKKELPRFLPLLLLFMTSMLILIVSNSIFLLLLGWDGLGLSSYLLVIYYQNAQSTASGTITILSNRVGDITIILSIATLMSMNTWNLQMNMMYPSITLILLLIATMSKSAQYPFAAWLPAAMAAPTPVSALVHSSTLVTAGVYLMIRLSSSFHPLLMKMLLPISIITSILASMSANWEQDTKKIIALSTLSQIAMMMFALTINCKSIAFFHLITHAFFKSTMFLAAGLIIFNNHYQDSRMLTPPLNSTPIPTTVLMMSSLALMGIPFMAGFYSKDSIIEFMMLNNMNKLMTLIMLLSLLLTIFYTIRMLMMTHTLSLKATPNSMIHNNKFMLISLLMMMPLSLTSGSLLTWIIMPNQVIVIPNSFKQTIIYTMIFSTILMLTLKFKSQMYNLMTPMALTLWHNHSITSSMMLNLTKLGSISIKLDNSWHEIYLPQNTYITMKLNSKIVNFSLNQTLFTMTLTSIMLILLMY